MAQLSQQDIQTLVDELEPELRTEENRLSRLDLVFSGNSSRPNINVSGASRMATLRIVQGLEAFGTLDSGMPALWALCELLLPEIGLDRQQIVLSMREKVYAPRQKAKIAHDPIEIQEAQQKPPHRVPTFVIGGIAAFVLTVGLIAVLGTLNAAHTPTPEPTFTALPPTPLGGGRGQIAFISNRTGYNEIFLIDVASGDQQQLTNRKEDVLFTSWSPDGSRIAFESQTRVGSAYIFVMDADGKNQRGLTNSGRDHHPAWSPDGNRIAFYSNRYGSYEIYTMNIDGTEIQQLTNFGAYSVDPAWSPDGTKIVFASNKDSGYWRDIYVMNADGSNVQNLTQDESYDCCAAWSPNGTQIAWQSNHGNHEIWVMSVDGEEQPRTLTTTVYGGNGSPAWSADGTQISFHADRRDSSHPDYTDNYDIWILDVISKKLTNLTNSDASDRFPAWRP